MSSSRVRVVVLDDGSINRSAVCRLAVYTGQDVAVVGPRPERLARALSEVGVAARTVVDDEAAASPLSELDAEIIVVGPPFDGAELTDRVQDLVRSGAGRLVHVLSPRGDRPPMVVAATRGAFGWVHRVAATLRDTWGVPVAPAADVLAPGSKTVASEGDLIVVITRAAAPDAQVPRAAVTSTVGAADIIHAVLTDGGLVVTNRTPLIVDVQVRLGRTGNADEDLAVTEFTLYPGQARMVEARKLDAVGALPGPVAMVRHWSHETETVYEGGQRRINGVDVCYRNAEGKILATAHHGSHRGLTVGITGDRITRDLHGVQQSLPQRWADQERPIRSLDELVGAIA